MPGKDKQPSGDGAFDFSFDFEGDDDARDVKSTPSQPVPDRILPLLPSTSPDAGEAPVQPAKPEPQPRSGTAAASETPETPLPAPEPVSPALASEKQPAPAIPPTEGSDTGPVSAAVAAEEQDRDPLAAIEAVTEEPVHIVERERPPRLGLLARWRARKDEPLSSYPDPIEVAPPDPATTPAVEQVPALPAPTPLVPDDAEPLDMTAPVEQAVAAPVPMAPADMAPAPEPAAPAPAGEEEGVASDAPDAAAEAPAGGVSSKLRSLLSRPAPAEADSADDSAVEIDEPRKLFGFSLRRSPGQDDFANDQPRPSRRTFLGIPLTRGDARTEAADVAVDTAPEAPGPEASSAPTPPPARPLPVSLPAAHEGPAPASPDEGPRKFLGVTLPSRSRSTPPAPAAPASDAPRKVLGITLPARKSAPPRASAPTDEDAPRSPILRALRALPLPGIKKQGPSRIIRLDDSEQPETAPTRKPFWHGAQSALANVKERRAQRRAAADQVASDEKAPRKFLGVTLPSRGDGERKPLPFGLDKLRRQKAGPQRMSDLSEPHPLTQAFLRLIPRKDTVGLDIGATQVRAALVRDGAVIATASAALPYGTIVNGLLANPAALTAAVRQLWATGLFKSRQINFSLANRNVALRTLNLSAAADARDLELAVAANADTVLAPLKTKNCIVDYAELSRSSQRVAMQLAAADKEMVKTFVRAIEAANCICVSCELGPVAEGRSLIVPRKQGSAHGIVNIGAEKTTYICASGQDILFMRILDLGGNDFTEAIQRQLNCTFEEAEQLKRRSGLTAEPVDPTLAEDPGTLAACQQALQQVSDSLSQEIAATPKYFSSLPEGRPLTGLTILGGGARLAGLKEQVALFSGVAELSDLDSRPGLELEAEGDVYAGALGLALGHNMSLMPDVRSRAFTLELPGVRSKPKLSTERTKKQVKRLTGGSQKAVSTNTLIFLAAAVLFGGSYLYGNHLKSANEKLDQSVKKAEAVSKSQSGRKPAPRYNGGSGNITGAQSAADTLISEPDYRVADRIAQKLAAAQVAEASINASEQGYIVSGSQRKSADTDALKAALAALPGVSAVKDVSGAGGKFTLQVQAPRSNGVAR